MKKWHLIFDVERCNSCNNCVLATKDEYWGNAFPGYSEPAPKHGLWFALRRHERGAEPMIDVSHYIETCNQCANAPCITEKTRDVISQRDDGIVVIDPQRAKGRKDLVDACPYGQIFWNEEQNLPQKWSFDAHLIDQNWAEPRCAQVCPTKALVAVKIEDEEMAKRAAAEGLTVLKPELGAGSRIHYRNFDRVTKNFLGGSLLRRKDGKEDCADNVRVDLVQGGKVLMTQKTDVFGDFKFEPLDGKGESYEVRVIGDNGATLHTANVVLERSQYIGAIPID
jgi:Fe-S-cluster-containing dehydrogenase component